MSIHPNVTKEDLIELVKLSKQQKNHRAINSKYKILKQTLSKQIRGSSKPVIKKKTWMNLLQNQKTFLKN